MNWYRRLRLDLQRSPLLWIVPLGIAAVIAAIIALNWGRTAYKKSRPVETCRQIRLGMTREQVLKIMPEPVGSVLYKRQGRAKEKLIFPSPAGASTPPQLVMDGKTGKVEEVICDEHYRLIQKQS